MEDSGWETVPLGDLCVAIYDGPHATPKKTMEGPIFLGISNLSQGRLDLGKVEHLSEEDYVSWTRRVTPQHNDLVFSYETRLGEAALIPQGFRCCLGRRMGLLRPDTSKVDPRFLLYAYLSPQFQGVIHTRKVHGSTVERIPLTELSRFPIRISSLPVQRRIAEILGALDDKIEVNRRINRTLEAMAQALYKHWFVDFGPFQDGEFVESELGPIPAGWEVGRLGDVIEVYDRLRVPLSAMERAKRLGPYPYYGATSIMDYVDDYLFDGIYVLVGEDGSVIKDDNTPFVQYVFGKFWVNNHAHVLQGKEISTEHLKVFLDQANVRAFVTGAVQAKISQSNLRKIPFVRPPRQVSQEFDRYLQPWFSEMRLLELEDQALATTRDYLLPKLLSGEIPVEVAEEMAG